MIRTTALLVLTLAVAGRANHCYGYRDHLTFMPDGSGKVEVTCSIKDDKDGWDFLRMVTNTKGAVAFTAPKVEQKDGWSHLSFTVYFEDVQKLYYNDDGPRAKCARGHDECLHFALSRAGDGFTLAIEDWLFSKTPNPDRSDWEDIRIESQNIIQRTVTLPGKVKKVEGFQRSEGRQAFYERSPKTIENVKDAAAWAASDQRRIECGPSELTDTEVAAFKKELEAAKAAWPGIKSDLEKAASEKKDAK